MSVLLALPDVVIHTLLCEWLGWRAVATLDTATCSRSDRSKLLACFQDRETFLREQPQTFADGIFAVFMSWTLMRKAKLCSIVLTDAIPSHDEVLCQRFAELHAPHLRSLKIKQLALPLPTSLMRALESCPRLTAIRVLDCKVMTGVEAIVTAAALHLELLHYFKCPLDNSEYLGDVAFPALKDFYLENCTDISPASVEQLCAQSPRTTKLILGDELNDAAVRNLSRHCARLETISFSLCPLLTDAALAPMLSLCSSLVTCDICMNEHVGDESAIALVSHCRHLRALALGGSSRVTDASAVAIAQHCGTRLLVLHLGRGIGITDYGVGVLAQHCTSIHTLLVSAYSTRISPTAVAELVSKLPGLLDLDIGNSLGAAPAIAALTKHCPKLQHLNLYFALGVTIDALIALFRGCKQLDAICVPFPLAEGLRPHVPARKILQESIQIDYWSKYSYAYTEFKK